MISIMEEDRQIERVVEDALCRANSSSDEVIVGRLSPHDRNEVFWISMLYASKCRSIRT